MATPKRNSNILIILGLVVLVVGTVLVLVVLRAGGKSTSSTAAPTANQSVPVLVSKRAIGHGTLGKDLGDAVEVRQVPAITRPSDALITVSELADRTAITDIGAGQQLRSAFFRQTTVRGSAINIPAGKQALAVTVPFTPAVAGYVGQGDMVNIYALATTKGDVLVPRCARLCDNPNNGPQASSRLVLTNVLVLDVSQEVAPSSANETTGTTVNSPGRSAVPTITYLVALDANQAERLVFFTSYADLYLSLVPKDQPASTTGGRDQNNALKP